MIIRATYQKVRIKTELPDDVRVEVKRISDQLRPYRSETVMYVSGGDVDIQFMTKGGFRTFSKWLTEQVSEKI